MFDEKTAKKKRFKNANWSDVETVILLQEVSSHYKAIVCKLQTNATVDAKRKVWAEIQKKVNAVGGRGRDSESCKKRWRDLKSSVIHKKTEAARTGGGRPFDSLPFEDTIAQILGSDTTLNSDGGADNFAAKDDMDCAAHEDADIESDQGEEVIISMPSMELSSTQLEPSDALLTTTFHPTPGPIQESESVLPVPSSGACSPASSASLEPPVKKMKTFIHHVRDKAKRREGDEETQLTTTWLKSEIEKNKSVIETNRLKQEKLKLQIEEIKARLQIEQIKARMAKELN